VCSVSWTERKSAADMQNVLAFLLTTLLIVNYQTEPEKNVCPEKITTSSVNAAVII